MKSLSLKLSIASLLTALTSAAVLATTPAASSPRISITLVNVGNPGNPADCPDTPVTTAPTDGHDPISITLHGYGAVSTEYQIGKYDVTAAQYCAFLNAVATTSDPYGVYNPGMTTNVNVASINRTGTDGNYKYSIIKDRGYFGKELETQAQHENLPIVYVSWFTAARFCNWMHNGQPVGPEGPATTETGAYNLNGATHDIAGDIDTPASDYCTLTPGAKYFIPTENQWIKAAYYNSKSTKGEYYDYPTMKNCAPNFNKAKYLTCLANKHSADAAVANIRQLRAPGMIDQLKSNKVAADAALAAVDTSNIDAYTKAHAEDQAANAAYNDAINEITPASYNTALNNQKAADEALNKAHDQNAPQNAKGTFGSSANCANYFIPYNTDEATVWCHPGNWNYQYCNGGKAPFLTPVGTFEESPSPYGAFDMGGNVYQWTSKPGLCGSRLIGGGCWKYMAPNDLDRGTHCTYDPSMATDFIGFRIAAAVPGATPYADDTQMTMTRGGARTSTEIGLPVNSVPASKKAIQTPIAPSSAGQNIFERASAPRL